MRIVDSAFDSSHYSLGIGHLDAGTNDGALELDRALAEADHDVLFLRLPHGHQLCGVLAERGQPVLDTLVTSSLRAARPAIHAHGVAIEHHDAIADERDIEALAEITATAITRSHLHADPRLPIAQTRRLYADWARNDARGRAQRTIVGRVAGELAGYISVLVRGRHALIDLVAVDPRRHGHGIGTALLASFSQWLETTEMAASVGTQADNPALRLYQRGGFVPTATHFSYHLWRSDLAR